jgi:hypothetical protein
MYQTRGFYLTHGIDIGGLRSYFAAVVSIFKGDALTNAAGYATNAYTAFDSHFVGIAAEAYDNSLAYTDGLANHGTGVLSTNVTEAAGVTPNKVLVIPPLSQYQFIVPVQNALATQAAVTTVCDLNGTNCQSISLADNAGVANSYLFYVDEIDVSAAALVGNAFGYAIGHFVSASA